MKNLYPVLLLLALSSGLSAQSFYDPSVLQEIRITFNQSNWDYLLDSLKNIDNGDYLLAQSVTINGETFDSVGIKYKGNSSYNPNNAKNPLHIELDFVRSGQNYQGIKDIKLSNGFADPTFVREPLSYQILRQYADAPQANHAKVWINGVYWGLYGNVESINKRFIRNHLKTDGNNPFFKCNPEDFGGPGTGGNYPDLVFSSTDSAFYYNKYDIQSEYGWKELLQLMDTLKNRPNSAAAVLDVDRALWMLAFNTLLVNLDSYTGAFAQNYYLYHDRNDRWVTYSWDLNMSFGAFPLLSTGGGGLLSLTQMKQLDPLTQAANSNRPLIKQLLSNPTYKRMYIAHMRTMLKENIDNDLYKNRALELQAVIDAAVQADTKKFFSYTDFTNNVTQTIPGGFSSVPGLTDLMAARRTYLNSNTNFTAVPPAISNVGAQPGGVVSVHATVQGATTVLLGWRADTSDVFQRVVMFDDGLHGDGAAGDGVYGGSFPQEDPSMQYYIYAENATAGIFSPERAEHEFYIATPLIPNLGDVVLNEFLADNVTDEVDEAGEHDDWLELYNNTASPVNLTGFYLTDDKNTRNKWAFPAGVSIPAHGFITVWLDDEALDGPYHANFKLDATGEHLMLSDGSNIVLDSVSFGQQIPDVSFGRYPNGTGGFTFMPTTYSAVNSLTNATSEPRLSSGIELFPNPASAELTVKTASPFQNLSVFNTLGQQVMTISTTSRQEYTLPVNRLENGVYLLRAGSHSARFMVQH